MSSFNSNLNYSEEYNIPEQEYQNHEQEDSVVTEDKVIAENNPIFQKPEFVNVVVKFPKIATPVDCISAATNCKDKIVASNKQIRLLQNRFYFIPVDIPIEINSDDYSNIKVYSEKAENIDVRYVKEGFACIIALKHNVKIKEDDLLAVLY